MCLHSVQFYKDSAQSFRAPAPRGICSYQTTVANCAKQPEQTDPPVYSDPLPLGRRAGSQHVVRSKFSTGKKAWGRGGGCLAGLQAQLLAFGDLFRKTHLTLLYFPLQCSFTSALSDLCSFRIQSPLFVLGPSLLSVTNPEASGQPGSVGGIHKDAEEKRDAVNPGCESVGFRKKRRCPRSLA